MKAHDPSGVGSSHQATNTSGYFEKPSCAERILFRQKSLQNPWENDDWNNGIGNNCVDMESIATPENFLPGFFSENCAQTQQALNIKTTERSLLKKIFWLRAARNPTISQLNSVQKFGFQITKQHPKKSLAKRNPPLVSTQETVFWFKSSARIENSYIWSRAPRTHSSIRTSPNPGEKKNIFAVETIKWARQQNPLWPPLHWFFHEDPYMMVDNTYISLVPVYHVCLFCSIEVHG